jgi:transcription elongation factor Elf1
MGTKGQVERIEPEGEIYTCPACGYTDGFHVSFNVLDNKNNADIYLICPNCHSRFELGWQVSLKKPANT